MGTPSLMKQAFTPYRTHEIIDLAVAARERHDGRSIDEIAEAEEIILMRIPDAAATRAGFSCILKYPSAKPIASSANAGAALFSFAEQIEVQYPAIVINPLRTDNEREVFWHEYYHLWYSPSRNTNASFFTEYSTAGVMDRQEERRANLFAAYVLIEEISVTDSVESLGLKYRVSPQIARLRL
jgi:hypothetical protein